MALGYRSHGSSEPVMERDQRLAPDQQAFTGGKLTESVQQGWNDDHIVCIACTGAGIATLATPTHSNQRNTGWSFGHDR